MVNESGYAANVGFFVIFIEFFFYAISVEIKAAKYKSGKQAGFEKNILPHKRQVFLKFIFNYCSFFSL